MPNLFIKLIYSMLIDADRLSSMCYETGEDFASYEKAQDEIQMTWKVYNQKLKMHLGAKEVRDFRRYGKSDAIRPENIR